MANISTPTRQGYPTPSRSSPVTPPASNTSATLPTPRTAPRTGRRSYDEMSKDQPEEVSLPSMSSRGSPVSPLQARPLTSQGSWPTDDDEGMSPTDDGVEEIRRLLEDAERSGGKEKVEALRLKIDAFFTQVSFLRQQLAAQQQTIAALQQQSQLAKIMADIERDRFAAERASWRAETDALLRARESGTAAGGGPKRVLDLDVGYHKELENANKRLEMDNRLMAPRLVDTQQQIEALVNELRHLRPLVLLNSSVLDTVERPDTTNSSGVPSPMKPPRPVTKARPTLGDARAEHLLLAAKKVRTMRNIDANIGRPSLDELQRHGVVGPGGGVGYSEGYHGEEEDELMSDGEKPQVSPGDRQRSVSTKPAGTPLLPKKKKRAAPTTPSRPRGTPRVPQTTPGGNFNDLLLAAEMATRPATPTRDSGPHSVMSATRSTSIRFPSNYDSPTKKPRREPPATVEWSTQRRSRPGEDSPYSAEISALSLLAQASQDVAEGTEARGMDRHRANLQRSRSTTPLGPAIRLQDSDRDGYSGREAAHTPGSSAPNAAYDDLFTEPLNAANDTVSSAVQSPSGATVPGIGKYVHLSSTMPARRTRSPYVKWTKEEDELLTRAVMEHGEKWDLVSKCVPTRSYHQVRQRWLRKTGAFDSKKGDRTQEPSPSPLGKRVERAREISPSPLGKRTARDI